MSTSPRSLSNDLGTKGTTCDAWKSLTESVKSWMLTGLAGLCLDQAVLFVFSTGTAVETKKGKVWPKSEETQALALGN